MEGEKTIQPGEMVWFGDRIGIVESLKTTVEHFDKVAERWVTLPLSQPSITVRIIPCLQTFYRNTADGNTNQQVFYNDLEADRLTLWPDEVQPVDLSEIHLQSRIVEYIRKWFPRTNFSASHAAGIPVCDETVAETSLKTGNFQRQPDILILRATRKYLGLAMEIYRPGSNIQYVKKRKVSGYRKGLERMLASYERDGYQVAIVENFHDATLCIEKYMRLKPLPKRCTERSQILEDRVGEEIRGDSSPRMTRYGLYIPGEGLRGTGRLFD